MAGPFVMVRDATVWAVIGPLVALAGLALIVVGLRALITTRYKSAAISLRNAQPLTILD